MKTIKKNKFEQEIMNKHAVDTEFGNETILDQAETVIAKKHKVEPVVTTVTPDAELVTATEVESEPVVEEPTVKEPTYKPRRDLKSFWKTFKEGDSVELVDRPTANSYVASAHINKIKVTTKKQEDGTIKLTRVVTEEN
jgi:hypothetical protein